MLELQAIDLILKKYDKNPKLTKREIGIWSHWIKDIPENNKPLSREEVERYKSYLKAHQLNRKIIKNYDRKIKPKPGKYKNLMP